METTLTAVALSSSGRMLIVGTESGTVRAIKLPLTTPWEGSSLPVHAAPVRKIAISADDSHLFSVSEDGCVMVFRLSDKEGRGVVRRGEKAAALMLHHGDSGGEAWSNEVLITRSDLAEKIRTLQEKETQVRELKIFNDYQLELKEMAHRDSLKVMTGKYEEEIRTLKARLQMIQSEKDKEAAKHDELVAQLVDGHTRQLMNVEHTQNQKLLEECVSSPHSF